MYMVKNHESNAQVCSASAETEVVTQLGVEENKGGKKDRARSEGEARHLK